jgi:hypothetical protein
MHFVGQVIPIDTLPDEVLLVIFNFFVDKDAKKKKDAESWQSLVHVCRRWRSIVFGSPRRLNLRLVCGAKKPVNGTLDVWPPFPLVIRGGAYTLKRVENIVAGLERSDRVFQIELRGIASRMETVLAAMEQPFPKLTDLVVKTHFGMVTDLPDSFLGGSSPHLRCLNLDDVSFPGLPKLLLSATHLVDLQLSNIPHSGDISPEAMVTALSTLTSLQSLGLKFLSPRSLPDSASQPPPPTRSVLPVLETLSFKGVTEYLDYFVARIDAPHLSYLDVAFLDRIIFDSLHFIQLITRTLAFEVLETAHVTFDFDGAAVKLSSETSDYAGLNVKVPRGELVQEQISSLQQVFTLCLLPHSTVTSENLYIYEKIPSVWLEDDIEDTLWLEILRPFTAVKNLYLSEKIASNIAPALQQLVGDRTTEVLPALEKISLEGLRPRGPVQKGIRNFIAARQLSGHPIVVSPLSELERDLGLRDSDLMLDE